MPGGGFSNMVRPRGRTNAGVESAEHFRDAADLLDQSMACGGGYFHHRGVLLGSLIHGVDGSLISWMLSPVHGFDTG